MSIEYALKRHAIEIGHIQPSGARRVTKRRFYITPDRVGARLFTAFLNRTGLRRLGERNALRPVVRRVPFALEGLPRAFDGYRILHLSDLHIDGLDGLADAVAERVSRLEVDLCVLTGDYRFEAHGPTMQIYSGLGKILSAVRSRNGVVGVLGNHDYAEEARVLGKMGVRMLINDAVEIVEGEETMWVVGLDDPHHYECDDLPGALARVPEESFKVLLVHSPEVIEEARHAGIGLYLCGHTHGGQVCLPLVGPVVVNADCDRRFVRGAWRVGGMQGYTSSGVGCSLLPVRFFCPPEIAVLELRSLAAAAPVRRDERVAA